MRTKTYAEAVASLFDLTGWESTQQAMRDDIAASDPEELVRAFKGVAELMSGMESTAEGSFGLAGELVFGEARRLAQFALAFCKSHAQGAESHFGHCPECGKP